MLGFHFYPNGIRDILDFNLRIFFVDKAGNSCHNHFFCTLKCGSLFLGRSLRLLTDKIIFCLSVIMTQCGAPALREPAEPFFTVIAAGETRKDAELKARLNILEAGLGSFVKSYSLNIDAQSRSSIISSATSGYVYDFKVLRVIRTAPIYEVEAAGRVNLKAVRDALERRYVDLGRPRLMIFAQEKLPSMVKEEEGTLTEHEFIRVFPEFDFIDPQQVEELARHEAALAIPKRTVLDDINAQVALRRIASHLQAEILIIVLTQVENAGAVPETEMHTYQAISRYKIVHVGSARILAAGTGKRGAPHINPTAGARNAIRHAVEEMRPEITAQLEKRWSQGSVVRFVVSGISYDAFLELGLAEGIGRLSGVNAVQDRGTDAAHSIILEVETTLSGTDLYRQIREMARGLGLEFKTKHVESDRIVVEAVKRP